PDRTTAGTAQRHIPLRTRGADISDGWRQALKELAASLASRVRRGANALERLVDRDPYHVATYRGYGRPGRLLVLARVLEDEGLATPDVRHGKARNLLAMLKRLESDPLPRARVRVSLPGGDRELVADDEGFVRQWLDADPERPDESWSGVRLQLLHGSQAAGSTAVAPILLPPDSAAYGVISDMDDTVLQSEVTNFLRAARMVLLENARTRLPFAGVAAFYRALREGSGGARNPIFYVSSSPWNLYDVISGFLDAEAIPAGPLMLRDWDLGLSLLRNEAHKSSHIREILGAYPGLPFILVGDSAQEDPEIYAQAVAAHPSRILAVYIRNVEPRPERSAAIGRLAEAVKAAGSTLVLADDTLTVASHAAAHGWIRRETLPEIGGEKRADEGEGGKADAPGVAANRPAPTVVVDPDLGPGDLA
ncbi:MAG TPA: phosphatase domain-containing protein, partial [Gemmatimonadales bacterium]|nr:phosphatase domain-containing protein [Gemmatimonadales bacterium]